MAPQSSAISTAPPARRSKFNRNCKALIDPSSIRRSPRFAPIKSSGNDLGIEGGNGWLSGVGGQVRRVSTERRLIIENLDRLGGRIGRERSGGSDGGGGGSSRIGRKRRSSCLALIDPSSIRRSPRFAPIKSSGNDLGIEGGNGGLSGVGGQVRKVSNERRLKIENLERLGGGTGREKSGGGCGSSRIGRKHRSSCLALIDPNSIRRSPRFSANGRDGALEQVKLNSSGHRNSVRRSPRFCSGKVSSKKVEFEETLRISPSNPAESGLEGTKGKRAKRETKASPLPEKKFEQSDTGSFLFGDPVLGGGSSRIGRKHRSSCLALIDPNSIRRSPRFSANGRDGALEQVELNSSGHINSFRRSPRFCSAEMSSKKVESKSCGKGNALGRSSRFSAGELSSKKVEFEEPLRISLSNPAESVLEGTKGKRAKRETDAAPLPEKKLEQSDTGSFLIGDPVPEEEAKRRWPWRFKKEQKCRKPLRLEPESVTFSPLDFWASPFLELDIFSF